MIQSVDSIQHNLLPPDNSQRILLHNEVHARPSQRIHMPALVVYVVVTNDSVTLEQERGHLNRLPSKEKINIEHLQDNFFRLRL